MSTVRSPKIARAFELLDGGMSVANAAKAVGIARMSLEGAILRHRPGFESAPSRRGRPSRAENSIPVINPYTGSWRSACKRCGFGTDLLVCQSDKRLFVEELVEAYGWKPLGHPTDPAGFICDDCQITEPKPTRRTDVTPTTKISIREIDRAAAAAPRDLAPRPIALPTECDCGTARCGGLPELLAVSVGPADPPPTDPRSVNPDEPLGPCRHCGAAVTARTLAAAFVDGLVCRKCDGAHGEPD